MDSMDKRTSKPKFITVLILEEKSDQENYFFSVWFEKGQWPRWTLYAVLSMKSKHEKEVTWLVYKEITGQKKVSEIINGV